MQKVFIKPTVSHKLLLEKFAMDTCKAILMILCTIFSSESEKDFRNLESFFLNFFSQKVPLDRLEAFRTEEFCSKSVEAELFFQSIQFLHSQNVCKVRHFAALTACQILSIKVKNRTKFFFQQFFLTGNLQGRF